MKAAMTPDSKEQVLAADREFAEWAKTMRTTPALLREAAETVGIAPRKIRTYLLAREYAKAARHPGAHAK